MTPLNDVSPRVAIEGSQQVANQIPAKRAVSGHQGGERDAGAVVIGVAGDQIDIDLRTGRWGPATAVIVARRPEWLLSAPRPCQNWAAGPFASP